jgi:hypothetical protein
VKVVLDDERTPDTEKYHGRKAEIIDIDFDDAGQITGNSQDNFMLELKFENGDRPKIHFRRQDVVKLQ